MITAGTIIQALILRSDPQDRVSKDGDIHSACGDPSRRPLRGLLRMRIV
jgi:hypothetical protein